MSGRYIARYRCDINHTMSDVIQCQIDIGQLYMYQQILDKNTISISFQYNSIINNNFKPVAVVVAAAVVAVVQ